MRRPGLRATSSPLPFERSGAVLHQSVVVLGTLFWGSSLNGWRSVWAGGILVIYVAQRFAF